MEGGTRALTSAQNCGEDTGEDMLVSAKDLNQDRWNEDSEKLREVPGCLSNKVSSNDSKHVISPVSWLPYCGDLETHLLPHHACVSPDLFLPSVESVGPEGREYTGKLGTATLSKRQCVMV